MDINRIRKYICSKVNCNIKVVSFQNRNKEEKYVGVLFSAYKNLFTIMLLNGQYKSFSYVDILIGSVRVYI